MKLIFKPIKLLLKIIVGILIIPAIILALLWKPINVPVDHYEDQSVTLQGAVTDSVDEFLLQSPANRSPLSIALNSKVANNEIRNRLLEQFDGSDPTNKEYVMIEDRIKFQGAWIDFKKDTINVNAGIHADAEIMDFKTSVLLSFKITDTEGIIKLKLSKLNIGRIPFAWASGLADTILKKTLKIDVEEIVEDTLNGMGEFNLKDRTLEIDLRNVVGSEGDNELIAMIIDLVYSEDLINFGVNEQGDEFGLGVALNINEIEDTTPSLTIPPALKINNEIDLKALLESKINLTNSQILSTLLTNKPEITFTELELNRVLDYFLVSKLNLANADVIQEMKVYEDYYVKILTPYLTLDNTLTSIDVPIRLGKTGGSEFMTTLKLEVLMSVVDKDLVFDVQAINLGTKTIEQSYIQSVMSLFGDNDNTSALKIEDTKITLDNFAANFEQGGLNFDGLAVNASELVLTFELEGVTTALENIIPHVPTEVEDAINDLLQNPDNEALVNDLINEIENLTPQQQADILALLEAEFGNQIP